MILEKRAARLIKHPWSLRLGGGVETVLMPGARSKRCRQARPLTGWVDSQSESDRGTVTLINAEPRSLSARSARPPKSRAASPAAPGQQERRSGPDDGCAQPR